ncbi:MAG: TonB-dependent receptor plug domain-containing protein, partial [Chitinophagaceae bacterium]
MRKIVSFCSALVLMLLLQVQSFAQEINLSGTILADEDGTPLVGVTVTNKATGKKTQTNSVGFYTIAASKGNKITFSYVGYANAEYIVGSETKHSIRLVESNKEVGNVVVTAFGATQSKRNTAYQTVTVSGDEITSTRRENFINSLAGRIPGAMITSTTGMPGSSTSIILRGPTSMDGSNQPIFVVDGLIIDNNAFEMQDRLLSGNSGLNTANRNNDFANRAADINPEDIESLTVLKGPEATALYGIDGANGAIVIVTKKGKKGKA